MNLNTDFQGTPKIPAGIHSLCNPEPDEELSLLNRLVDRLLLITTAIGVIAVICANVRAASIGWNYRDFMQIITLAALVMTSILRKSINPRHKALFLTLCLVMGGVSGMMTLGMLAGGVFFFPMAVVILALFYSPGAIILVTLATLSFCGLVGADFCKAPEAILQQLATLHSNPVHWAVYIVCMAFFFIVIGSTIHDYRKYIAQLLQRMADSRIQLDSSRRDLRQAAAQVKILNGLLSICSSCHKIRDDRGYWNQIESYIRDHSEAQFSHSICPDCLSSLYPPEYSEDQDTPPENFS